MQPTEHELLNEFLDNFKRVFDEDWGHTEAMIRDAAIASFVIGPQSTFLHPGVEDERDTWANRGALLESYRELITYLKENELIAADF
jgi:hypothetical protein